MAENNLDLSDFDVAAKPDAPQRKMDPALDRAFQTANLPQDTKELFASKLIDIGSENAAAFSVFLGDLSVPARQEALRLLELELRKGDATPRATLGFVMTNAMKSEMAAEKREIDDRKDVAVSNNEILVSRNEILVSSSAVLASDKEINKANADSVNEQRKLLESTRDNLTKEMLQLLKNDPQLREVMWGEDADALNRRQNDYWR